MTQEELKKIIQKGTYNLIPIVTEVNNLIVDAYREGFKDCWELLTGEKKPIEMKSAEESLGVSHEEYNKIVDECIFGEQNPTNDVKPKFKIGCWVVFNNRHNSVYQVEKIENYEYTLRHFLGGSMPLSFSHEDMIRVWTIQDAKDGDVLKEDSCIFILKKIKSQDTAITHCCLFDDGDFNLSSKICFDVDSTYPATKEQRDTLMKAITDAGYTFDFERRELKKIEQKSDSFCREHCL